MTFDQCHHGACAPGLDGVEIESEVTRPWRPEDAVALLSGAEGHTDRAGFDRQGGDLQRMAEACSGLHALAIAEFDCCLVRA